MRVLSLVILVWVAVVSNGQLEDFVKAKPVLKYHEKYGIPQAKKLKEAEDLILAEETDSGTKIVGGTNASIRSYPYLVGLVISLIRTTDQSVCGASLLDKRKLVTAAHCWDDGYNQAWLFTAVLGSDYVFDGGVRIPTTTVYTHPDFNPNFYENDVAVVMLTVDVEYSDKIQPIALPSGDQLTQTFVGQWATAAGYGRVYDDVRVNEESHINQVELNIIPSITCTVSYGSEFVHASTLCTSGVGGVGICLGDSGGPLVLQENGKQILVGISSYVAVEGCSLGFPSAFARVTSFYDFITQTN